MESGFGGNRIVPDIPPFLQQNTAYFGILIPIDITKFGFSSRCFPNDIAAFIATVPTLINIFSVPGHSCNLLRTVWILTAILTAYLISFFIFSVLLPAFLKRSVVVCSHWAKEIVIRFLVLLTCPKFLLIIGKRWKLAFGFFLLSLGSS